MLKVFEQKDLFRYDPARGRFRAWLGTLVANRVADFRRKPSERVRASGDDSHGDPLENVAEASACEDDWNAAFEQSLLLVLLDVVRHEMSPRAYLAFELSTLHGLPGDKVAQHTGLTAQRRLSGPQTCAGPLAGTGGRLSPRRQPGRTAQAGPAAAARRGGPAVAVHADRTNHAIRPGVFFPNERKRRSKRRKSPTSI